MSELPSFQSVKVGDELPPLTLLPITRATLAYYCGASGDPNPMHVDSDFARAAGYPDVFAHGMLSMAYLGRALTHWVPIDRLRRFNVRFSAITEVHDTVTCAGRIVEKRVVGGERCARIALEVTTQRGVVTLRGEAVVALN